MMHHTLTVTERLSNNVTDYVTDLWVDGLTP